MRKIVNIFLVLLLLFSTTGVAISKHYCGEILQSISVNGPVKSCCENQDMPEDCCSDEVSIDKTDELQLTQLNLNLAFSPYVLYYATLSIFNFSLEQLDEVKYIAFFDSPPITEQEIFILDQAFLL